MLKIGAILTLVISCISLLNDFSNLIFLGAVLGWLAIGVTLFETAGYFSNAKNLFFIGWVVRYLLPSKFDVSLHNASFLNRNTGNTKQSTPNSFAPKVNPEDLFNTLKFIILGQDDFLIRLSKNLSSQFSRQMSFKNETSVLLILGEQKSGKTSLQQAIGRYIGQFQPLNPVFIRSNEINEDIGRRLSQVNSSLYIIDDFDEVSVSYQTLLIKEIDRLQSVVPIVFLILITLTAEEMLSIMKQDSIASKRAIDRAFDLHLGAKIFNSVSQNIKSKILLSCVFPRISRDVLVRASSYFMLSAPDTNIYPEIGLQRISALAKNHGVTIQNLTKDMLLPIVTSSIKAADLNIAPGYWLLEIDKLFHDDLVDLQSRGIKRCKLTVDQDGNPKISRTD